MLRLVTGAHVVSSVQYNADGHTAGASVLCLVTSQGDAVTSHWRMRCDNSAVRYLSEHSVLHSSHHVQSEREDELGAVVWGQPLSVTSRSRGQS